MRLVVVRTKSIGAAVERRQNGKCGLERTSAAKISYNCQEIEFGEADDPLMTSSQWDFWPSPNWGHPHAEMVSPCLKDLV